MLFLRGSALHPALRAQMGLSAQDRIVVTPHDRGAAMARVITAREEALLRKAKTQIEKWQGVLRALSD